MSKPYPNLARIFYRSYYQDSPDPERLDKVGREDYARRLAGINERLFGASLSHYAGEAWPAAATDLAPPYYQCRLQTTYPGLFTGAGVAHETGALGEIKLGFAFDAATGLPVVPGSSVKGCLRHYLRQLAGAAREYPAEVAAYLQALAGTAPAPSAVAAWLERLVTQVFEGPDHPYARDVFFDAMPVATTDARGRFLGPDFITPHGNPLKSPVPVAFMKLLPGVTLCFSFRLSDFVHDGVALAAADKLRLFGRLLQDWGIGAKSRSGYGRLVDPAPARLPAPLSSSTPAPQTTRPDQPAAPRVAPTGPRRIDDLAVGEVLTCTVTGYEGGRIVFALPVQEQTQYRQKVKSPAAYPVGATIRIRITGRNGGQLTFAPVDL